MEKVQSLDKKYFVYILECNDGTLYTGWTVDIQRRLNRHNQGLGAKYTRSRCPVTLKYLEECTSKNEACRREAQIKRYTRESKLALTLQGTHDGA